MYFDSVGKINTQETIALALKTAAEKNIKYMAMASSSGDTAKLLLNVKDIQIICVTLANGFFEPGQKVMTQEVCSELEEGGIRVLRTTHALSGAERGISRAFGGVYPVEIIAYALRMFGQGTKVCVEISVMALDAGLIPYGEPIIAIGGTGKGVDTALILTPSHANSIFETKIHEIICKPSRYNDQSSLLIIK